SDEPGPAPVPQPRVEARDVDRRKRQQPIVVDELADATQGRERVDEVLQDVEEDDGVSASRGLIELLERPLAQVDPEPLPPELDRPPRRLITPRLPARLPGHVEEQPDV